MFSIERAAEQLDPHDGGHYSAVVGFHVTGHNILYAFTERTLMSWYTFQGYYNRQLRRKLNTLCNLKLNKC